jgi:hypothetical protein
VLMRSGVWLARGGRGIAGGEHQIVKAVKDKRAQPRCAVRPQKRRIFCLQNARTCFGGIIQKPTTRAAPTLAMAVQGL